ncbi:MAG TPA: tetratricopeptide repeat protein [Planctomycetota bacterium]|nr:tetratricopeptide repeat protein [Planctomycetota bacterium]
MLRRPPWPLVAVWLCTLAVFLPALAGEYADDDLDLLETSPTFAGIEHLFDAVRAPFWGYELGYWRPLTSALLCVGHEVGGGHPVAIHAAVLLVHLGAATLAFGIARRLGVGPAASAAAAALFALHPCQVESVAWVAAAGDPLAGAATLLSVWAWLGWRARSTGLPWLAWLAFALALASKESGLMALGWIAAAEVVQRGEPGRRGVFPAWGGLLVVVGLWFWLRVLVFGDLGAGFDRGRLDLDDAGLRGVLLRAWLAGGFLAVPTGWLGFTPYRVVPADPEGLRRALVPFALIAALWGATTFAAVRARRRVAVLGALGFGVAITPAVLLPANLGPWPLVDRYVYTALFGVALLLAGSGLCPPAFGAVLALAAGTYSATLVPQWRSHDTVVDRALRDVPEHPEAHYLAANRERARMQSLPATLKYEAERRERARAAFDAYQRVQELLEQPLYAGAHLRAVLGVHAAVGAADVALAGGLRPPGVVLAEVEALARAHPSSASVQVMLGVALHATGDFTAAEQAWRRALELDPGSEPARANLVRLYRSLGREEDAQALEGAPR